MGQNKHFFAHDHISKMLSFRDICCFIYSWAGLGRFMMELIKVVKTNIFVPMTIFQKCFVFEICVFSNIPNRKLTSLGNQVQILFQWKFLITFEVRTYFLNLLVECCNRFSWKLFTLCNACIDIPMEFKNNSNDRCCCRKVSFRNKYITYEYN